MMDEVKWLLFEGVGIELNVCVSEYITLCVINLSVYEIGNGDYARQSASIRRDGNGFGYNKRAMFGSGVHGLWSERDIRLLQPEEETLTERLSRIVIYSY
jgi:hypothetical protein